MTWVAFALLSTACTGAIGLAPGKTDGTPSNPTDDPGTGPGGAPMTPPPVDQPKSSNAAGSFSAARLTAEQYSNTVRDLLGDESTTADALGEDLAGDSGFTQPGSVSSREVSRFMEVGEAVASRAVSNLTKLLGCDPTKNEEACTSAWLPKFARRAYRRPLTTEELSDLTTYYADVRKASGQTVAGAIRIVIATMLQSPNFLYRWELGPTAAKSTGGVVALTNHEVASRLSYFLWSSMPDDDLFAAADAGKLGTPADIATAAKRMLASPKAQQTIASFHDQWLGLLKIDRVAKDTSVYPTFDDGLRQAMVDEARTFVQNVFATDGKLSTLLGATYTFANEKLAKTYGVTGVTGDAMKRIELDPKQRFGGILTQAGFLSAHAQPSESSPVKRGVTVRQKVMCQVVPAPKDMMFEPPAPDPNKSTREQFAQHSADPGCQGCHKFIDALGFGLDNFDGIGKYREKQAGQTVDSSGLLVGLASGDVSFANGAAMMKALRESPEVSQCLTTQWMRFALRRADEGADAASLTQAQKVFESSGYDMREMIIALAQTPAFRFRSLSEGEVHQ